MGFLRTLLFGKRAAPPVELVVEGPGDYEIAVVGESNYQEALERAAGGRTDESCEKVVDAVLILQYNNPHDRNAVMVTVNGETCGYLNRDDAKWFRGELSKGRHQNIVVKCKAMIVGGWYRSADDFGYFGIRLDLPE